MHVQKVYFEWGERGELAEGWLERERIKGLITYIGSSVNVRVSLINVGVQMMSKHVLWSCEKHMQLVHIM